MKMEWFGANAPYFSWLVQTHIFYVPAAQLLLYYHYGLFCGVVVGNGGGFTDRGVFLKILKCNSVGFSPAFPFWYF